MFIYFIFLTKCYDYLLYHHKGGLFTLLFGKLGLLPWGVHCWHWNVHLLTHCMVCVNLYLYHVDVYMTKHFWVHCMLVIRFSNDAYWKNWVVNPNQWIQKVPTCLFCFFFFFIYFRKGVRKLPYLCVVPQNYRNTTILFLFYKRKLLHVLLLGFLPIKTCTFNFMSSTSYACRVTSTSDAG